MKKYSKLHFWITVFYFTLYLIVGGSLLIKQPFGNPPDEYNRYLIPQYIAEHGTLPNGYEESIRINDYGFSYGFQPILPYMLQGYAMRFTSLFTDNETALLYTARSVNLFLGLLTAWFVLRLAGKWFPEKRLGWFFSFLATFLPQSIFVHTYVNTDSCCILSIAIMLYGLTLGLRDNFSGRSSVIMAIGIILCALSYYNAYGYILSCILLFTVSFLSFSSQKPHFHWNAFLRKGLFISAIVLLGISWWFIRSAILYDGDFLGLKARNECAVLYASPKYHPDTRVTWQSQGFSLWDMLFDSDFWMLSSLSFIGIYGAMSIITSIWVYRFYKTILFCGVLFCLALPLSATTETKSSGLSKGRRGLRIFYHLNMVFCMIMPFALSLYYSYTVDYQPQGRYLLPALLPLCYYTTRGLEKFFSLQAVPFFKKDRKKRILTGSIAVLCAIIVGSLLLTVYGYAFPYYEANPVAP